MTVSIVAVTKKAAMQVDGFGNPIQGALFPESTIVIPFTDSAGVNTNSPIVAQVVRLIASQDCFVKFGDSSGVVAVASTDMLIKAGQAEYFSTGGNKYISAVQSTAGGSLFVTIMR